ncbi:hypothetical protein [Nocardioides sp. NPDC047086]|uniref:hypothetical protein n=1 Tax=Nocardioides sp. NPDC047086 TaxID=3154810 RepID=UPI0033DE6E69
MSLDLEDELRTSSDLTLDRSLAQIRVRGDRLRRRRTSLLIATTAAVCLVATGLVLAVSGRGPLAVDVSPADQSSGPRPPDQVLTWSGKPTNVTDAELTMMKKKCLPGAQQDAATTAGTNPEMPNSIDPDRLYPIFAERRTDFGPEHDDILRTMFLTDGYLVHCGAYTTDSGQPRTEDVVGSADRIKPFPDMGRWEHFSSSWTTNWISFMLPVPDEAASVKFFIGGGYVDGTINSGIAAAWISAAGVKKSQDTVGFAVFDADGRRIGGVDPVPSKAWPAD